MEKMLQVIRTGIKSRMSSNLGRVGLFTTSYSSLSIPIDFEWENVNCQCSSGFCLSLTYLLFNLFRIASGHLGKSCPLGFSLMLFLF